jgi:hypothetical protein
MRAFRFLAAWLAIAGPASAADPEPAEAGAAPVDDGALEPFLAVVGGGYYQAIDRREDIDDQRQDRFTTVALSRLGLRGTFGESLAVESEIELNAGPYGTSVWEGQAAIQVRNQLLRLTEGGLRVDVGRVTDEASLDYFSAFAVGNMLLTDDLARFPLLVSGFNRGNGVLVRYELVDGLNVGATLNAGNPTSSTSTVMVGGTFPPFARFYEVPWSNVGRDARGFPTASFHAMLASPAITLDTDVLGAQAELQAFRIDTNTNSEQDEPIQGFNVRGGLQGRIAGGRFRPFVNGSRIVNDVVDPNNTAQLSGVQYVAVTASAGADLALSNRFGIGAQGVWIREQQGSDGTVFGTGIANVGGSVRVAERASVDARYGMLTNCEDGECVDGEHRVYLTVKALVGRGIGGQP